MKPRQKPADDITMSAAEFDRLMRGALQAPPPKEKPKKSSRTKKPKEQAAE